jgi:O-antigen/teichoic acid export membrane protein
VKLIKAVLVGVVIFAIGIGIYIALCPIIIPWLFPKYDASQVILLTSISAITLVVQPMSLLSQYLEAQRMIKAIWYSNLTAAIAFGISMIFLIPFYGLLGAMIARGIFRFVYSGMSWWYVLRSPLRTE